jgi:hypothetical protein
MNRNNIQESLERENKEVEPIKIVTRFADGRLLKGYTCDFFPNKLIFRLLPVSGESPSEPVKINVEHLKAIFFVRDFTGNAAYDEQKNFAADRSFVGRKVEVTFRDGEVLVGTTLGYDPSRPGFFLYPADPESNNLRVFAVSTAVRRVRYL